MTHTHPAIQKFAADNGWSYRDAEMFVGIVASGVRKGMSVEDAIVRGRDVLARVLYAVAKDPEASKDMIPGLYESLRGDRAGA